MRILFCKISSMKYYKGVSLKDQPVNGGKFVDENGYGHEEFNFRPIEVTESENADMINSQYCFGFVETKSTVKTKSNELHIEKIDGCAALRNEPSVDDVLVIWCATSDLNETTVVGWYKHATVYRLYQPIMVDLEDGTQADRGYNVFAASKDCVLLPAGTRHRHVWNAASAKKTRSFGFGQSLIWYASEEGAKPYIERLLQNINNYQDENWLNEYPEEN